MRRAALPLLLALLAVPTCAQTVPADGTSVSANLPPIPSWAPSPLGPIRVHLVPELQCGGEPAYGCFHYDTRLVEVRDSIPRVVQWQALHHELVHSALYHAGITFDDANEENKVADAVANQQVMEMIGRWPR